MNLPKISVITPSFNQSDYLEETILSVINQNYPNLEYIIIDGGSDDRSIDIIKKYASHITYWISEKDSGQSEALNKGFKKCTGDIVTWLNSDDCYTEGALHKVADCFSKGNFALVYGKSILFGQGRKEKVIGLSDKNNTVLRCLAYVPFPQPSTFFRKEVLMEQGFLDETLHYCMDHDLFARIVLNYVISGTDDVLSRYRYHDEGKSNFPWKFAEERTRVFSRVLRSFPMADSLVQILKDVGLYSEGTDMYKTSVHFNLAELKKLVIYFLVIQMHTYYQALAMKKARTIAKFLLNNKDELINKGDAGKIFIRSLLLPKQLILFLRKFTQK